MRPDTLLDARSGSLDGTIVSRIADPAKPTTGNIEPLGYPTMDTTRASGLGPQLSPAPKHRDVASSVGKWIFKSGYQVRLVPVPLSSSSSVLSRTLLFQSTYTLDTLC